MHVQHLEKTQSNPGRNLSSYPVETSSVSSQLNFNAKDKGTSLYAANRKLKYCQEVLGEVYKVYGEDSWLFGWVFFVPAAVSFHLKQ